MSVRYTSGKFTQAVCDRCGEWFKLNKLKKLTIKDNTTNIKVCSTCWEPSHPQLRQGQYPVVDPQAVREPRPDTKDSRGALYGYALLIDDPTLAYYGLEGYLLQESGDRILNYNIHLGYDVLTEDNRLVWAQNGYTIISE